MNIKQMLYTLIKRPHVVEQGESNGFTYRKWSDGVVECWGTFTKTVTINAMGNIGRGVIINGFTYPTSLFTEPPSILAEVNNSAVWTAIESGSTTNIYGLYLLSHSAVASKSYSIAIHAIGKWK